MNFLFLSPHFPPHFVHFARALRDAGVRVVAIADAPPDTFAPELREVLAEAVHVPDLNDRDALVRAAGYLTWRHGKLDRVESLNEHWLLVEAELREAFNVPGLLPADVRRLQSKYGSHLVFQKAGLPDIPTAQATSLETCRAFGKRYGYPLVLKPEVGVGAADAGMVRTEAELVQRFESLRPGFLVQPYVKGTIVTFDGVADRSGKVCFALSHEYSEGVMETVAEQRDISFWSLRDIPAPLRALGEKVVAALGLTERWFHIEFFRTAPDRYVVLEANLRPPGGFMPDMMNYACDTDVYRLYAAVVAGRDPSEWIRPPRHHVCHVARRRSRAYAHTSEELVRELGEHLLWHREPPALFRKAMGDEMFLIRHVSLEEMHAAVRRIQQPA
ncbi:MAG: ATP-grasp domain-containing protein [Deltaproteobacteria bacterium]|nr:ATP-grasp domain-containing protein [Deltaproteobacteria bacterium]